MNSGEPSGYITLTLHAHLPYVVNHGTWPHGLEWLHEAAAETYLPLLRVFRNLERDGIAIKANLNISSILLEQLSHPVFLDEFPKYLERKILAAQEDENYFRQSGEERYARTARYWLEFFQLAMADFLALDRDIIRGFRYFNESGQIEIITCAATHAYFPLLGTDESITAQIKIGVAAHERHIGRRPRGIWAPECGYRPAGMWQAPMMAAGQTEPWQPFERMGIEEAIAQGELEYFFVDTHLVEEGTVVGRHQGPYQSAGAVNSGPPRHEGNGADGHDQKLQTESPNSGKLNKGKQGNGKPGNGKPGNGKLNNGDSSVSSVYRPYLVDGPHSRQHPVSIFPRDPRTGLQVWSGDTGYPGDGRYLDFHKKRWPGGHRYWQVTEAKADLAFKTEYLPEEAAARAKAHAEHFVGVVCEVLKSSYNQSKPPILTSPFDAELFGHWWYEGPMWLEHVARIFAREECPVKMITCGEYIDKYPSSSFLALPEGSWGKNGTHEVWLNPDTSWTWTHIYPAERTVRTIATEGRWRDDALGERIVKQLCRELLLLESSDWQFLITTGAARDYAESRFMEHVEHFSDVEDAWHEFLLGGHLSPAIEDRLTAIELRDSIFAEIDPSLWTEVKRS